MTTIADELRGMRRQIYEAVAAAGPQGIARTDIEAKIYAKGECPKTNSIKVLINRINNETLKKRGLRITALRRTGWGGVGIYYLREVT